jgi:hypothetical protein
MADAVKLLLTWNIASGQEEACLAFITQDLPISMQKAGFELTDAWFTAYGSWPQIRIGFLSSDLDELRTYLMSDVWMKLKERLLTYSVDYQQKIIEASRSGFQF